MARKLDGNGLPTDRRFINLLGQDFGRLHVIEYAGRNKHRGSLWRCICRCGTVCTASGENLRCGSTSSCGCLARDGLAARTRTHGRTGSPEHVVWKAMNGRCRNQRKADWDLYGGRGITVCERWRGRNGFANFLSDMGPKPPGTSIDRIDNEKGYSPGNCRWATMPQQQRNRRSNVVVTHNGNTMVATDLAILVGMPPRLLLERLRHRWSVDDAISTPPQRRTRRTATQEMPNA